MERKTIDPNIQSTIGSLASLGRMESSLRARYERGDMSAVELARRCLGIQERGSALVKKLEVSLQDHCGPRSPSDGLSLVASLGGHDNLPPNVLVSLIERFGTSHK